MFGIGKKHQLEKQKMDIEYIKLMMESQNRLWISLPKVLASMGILFPSLTPKDDKEPWPHDKRKLWIHAFDELSELIEKYAEHKISPYTSSLSTLFDSLPPLPSLYEKNKVRQMPSQELKHARLSAMAKKRWKNWTPEQRKESIGRMQKGKARKREGS